MPNFLNKHLWVLLIGFSLNFFIAAWPEIRAFTNTPEGYVWTPFNSLNYHMGDTYYYWPLTLEVLEGSFLVQTQSAPAEPGVYGIQLFNAFAAAVSALPRLLVEDPRWIYFLGFFGAFAAYFALAYLFTLQITNSRLAAFLSAMLFTWYYDLTLYLLPSFSKFKLVFMRFNYFFEYDMLFDRLRFLNTNVVFLISAVFLFVIINLKLEFRWTKMLFAAFLLWGVAWSYPGQFFVIFQFVIVGALLAFLKKDKKFGVALLFIAGFAILTLLSTNYFSLYQLAKTNSPFVGLIFGNDFDFSFTQIPRSFSWGTLYLDLAIGFACSWFLMFFASARDSKFRFWVDAAGICLIANLLLLSMSSNEQVVGRVFSRGMLSYWSLLLFAVVTPWIFRSILTIDNSAFRRCTIALALLVLGAAFYFPVNGMASFANRLAQKSFKSRYFLKSEFDSYEWMRTNIPSNEVVLVDDWELLTIIPMITHANLFYGHWLMNNRPVEVELEKFLATKKLFGYQWPEILTSFADGCKQAEAWSSIQNKKWDETTIPMMESDHFDSAMFLFGIFYWPYIKSFRGIEICKNDGTINGNFIQAIHSRFDQVGFSDFASNNIRWVVTRSNSTRKSSLELGTPSFENDFLRVYKVK